MTDDAPPRTTRRAAALGAGVLILAAVGLTLGGLVWTSEPGPTEAERALLDRFDRLGYGAPPDAPFVRVASGWWSQYGDGPPQNAYLGGFLLEEEPDRFTVLTLDLERSTFERTPEETPEHARVGFETVDLTEQVPIVIAALGTDDHGDWPWSIDGMSGSRSLGAWVQATALAAALDRRGEPALAHRILDASARSFESAGVESIDPGTGARIQISFGEHVWGTISHHEMWRTVEAFGDPEVTRPELLERLEALLARFPESGHAERALEMATLLRTMIVEDEAHAASSRPPDELSEEERIAVLVHRLRDQNGHQWSQPGAVDFFTGSAEEGSPAARLVAIGYPAVPALIDALSDERFTRSVGFHRNFYFSHRVARVGDCARAIIPRIAGRNFYAATDEETRAEIERWWAELRDKGERRVLIDAVARGERESTSLVERLIERYPADALDAIIAGARRAEDPHTRGWLITSTASLEGEALVPFLLEEVRDAPGAFPRMAAASSLHAHGRPEGLAAATSAWRSAASGEPGVAPLTDQREIVDALLAVDEPEAIEALADGFAERPLAIRTKVIDDLGHGFRMNPFRDTSGMSLLAASEPTEAAIEALLAAALDDDEEDHAFWTVGDRAVATLAARLPDRYTAPDVSAGPAARRRARATARRAFRRARGLPELPAAPATTAPAVAPGTIEPLLDRLLDAGSETARAAIEERIVALGLGALPAVRARTEAPDAASRATLEALERRLGVIVRTGRVTSRSRPPGDALAARLAALEGRPLDADRLLDLHDELLRAPPPDVGRFRIGVDRDEEDGLTVSLSLRAADPDGDTDGDSVEVAGASLWAMGFGGRSPEDLLVRETHAELHVALGKAFVAPARVSIRIRLGRPIE